MDFYAPFRVLKNIWIFLIVNIAWGSLVSLYYNPGAFEAWDNFLIGAALGAMISITYLYGFILIWFELDKRYHWIDHTFQRIFFGLLYGLLYAVVSFALVIYVHGLIFKGAYNNWWGTFLFAWKNPVINFFPSALIVCAFAFFKNWSRSVVNGEKLKAELMLYKFESLQNQLNPHFLFNSFNVLSNLVYDDKELAKRFIDELGKMYNYVLDSKEKTVVKLQEEIDFVLAYGFLLQTRFENKFSISVNLDEVRQQYIAPMVLQLLVENAVKHNVITTKDPLNVEIYSSDNYLFVKNKKQVKKTAEKSTQTGLANIRERYSLLTDQPMTIEDTDSQFVVGIPFLTKKI